MKHTLFKICICVQMNTDLKNNLTCCCCCCCHSAFNNQYDAYLKKNKNPKLVNLLTGLKISSWKASLPNKVFAQPGIILSSCFSRLDPTSWIMYPHLYLADTREQHVSIIVLSFHEPNTTVCGWMDGCCFYFLLSQLPVLSSQQ